MKELKSKIFGTFLLFVMLFSFSFISAELSKTDIKDVSCESDDERYPFGFRKNESYCGYDEETYERHQIVKTRFHRQKEAGKVCVHSFECESNFCNNGKWFSGNISKLINLENKVEELKQRISKLEDKINNEKEQNQGTQEDNKKEIKKEQKQPNNTENLQDNKKENNSKGGIGGFFRRLFS